MAEKKKKSKMKSYSSETKKIVWPDAKETSQLTVIVIVVAAIVAIACWLLDALFGWLIGFFI